MKRRPSRLLVVLALVATVAGGVYAYQVSLVPKRFAVVQEGHLYRSSQPSTRQIQHMIDTLGLKTILIVRSGKSSRVPDEIEYAQSRGLKVVHIPIESRQTIPEPQIAEFFRSVDDPSQHPILVHCSAGRHRTGYLCARYRIDRQGWPLERAIDELRSFGFDEEDQGVVMNQIRSYKPIASATTMAQTPSRVAP
ncbi:MAG: tyrosine-protein phosphatase [Planctomycetota bacterium]